MKATKLVVGIMAIALISLGSCKEKAEANTEEATEETVSSNTETEAKAETKELAYSCPMDCEDGKTYAEEGSCPVCKMDLTLNEAHKGKHKKEKMCQCKEGECKCKEGECKCGTPGHDHFGNKISDS